MAIRISSKLKQISGTRFDKKSIKMEDKIVQSVIDKFNERSKLGIQKYGTTLDQSLLTFDQWLTHAQEEAMDFVLYLEKIKKLGVGNAKLH